LEDAEQTGAKPAKKEEETALWALLCAVFALAALALEVKRPDIVPGALDAGESVSSGIFGLIASGLCVFAIRRSVLRALPGLMLTVLYWVLLVVVLRR
jgi:hypothetical protein